MKNKKQLHYAVLALSASSAMWNIAVVFLLFLKTTQFTYFFQLLYFLGPILVSLSVLFLGLSFAYYRIEFSFKWILIFIPPITSAIMLFTNHLHRLFFTTFSLIPSEQDFGVFFTWHSIVSYLYIGVGLVYLIVFSIKNQGLFSKQSLLIISGIAVSLLVDSFSTLNLNNLPTYVENITFAFTIACFMLAMFRYDFLNIVPIASQIIFDSLTDSYLVINDDYEIIDFNKSFTDKFSRNYTLKRKDNVFNLLQKVETVHLNKELLSLIRNSIRMKEQKSFDFSNTIKGKVLHHEIGLIPVYSRQQHVGTVIMIKDVTESKRYLDKITMLNQQLHNLAIRDGLTKAYNRYFFEERLQQEIDRVLKLKNYGNNFDAEQDSFGLIMFDIDHFKIYNDNNGHQAGDELLQSLVQLVNESIFPTDILCRYGGEEFAVICCETSLEGIKPVAEKIRGKVAEYNFKLQAGQPGGKVTISVGAAYYCPTLMDKETLIKKADENLYVSKNRGRNVVTIK